MPPNSAPARPDASRAAIGKGSVLGGRFEIERAVADDPLGTLLAARDQKTNRAIAVRIFAPGLIATPAAIETLRAQVKIASSIQHKSVVGTYGMGSDPSGARFVACEWVEGQTLGDLVRAKQAKSQPMSLRGVYNVVAHVCQALEAAQEKGTCHGALRPAVVWVTKSGKVKVSSIGIDRAIVETAGPAALGASEQAFLAPEVRSGDAPDARSDVFGLGGLLYAMLTGRTAADEFVAPSDAHPEANAQVDEVLLKCLAAFPGERYATPHDVKEALVALTPGTGAAEDVTDFGVVMETDSDIGSVPPPANTATRPKAPPAPQQRAMPKPPPRPGAKPQAPAGPQVGARVALDQSFRPFQEATPPAAAADVDLGGLLAKITENDAARWMVVKDNLDHGPFSGRELVQLILKGEVLGHHGLLNMDSGERRRVREAPEFVEFLEQFRIKKAAADEKVALERSAKREKLSTMAYAFILIGVAGVVGLGVAIYFLTRPDAQNQARGGGNIADLYERGEIEITGTAGILPDPQPGHGGRRRSGGGGGGGSYEDAMNQVVNLGNVAEGGDMSRLSPQQVAGVMNGNINRLIPCVAREPDVGNVRIDLAIAGTGQVLGASVRNGSPDFQRCVEGRVRGIRFPRFGAPRMGASYSFSSN